MAVGTSPLITAALFPRFDMNGFPFVFTKEKERLCILDVKAHKLFTLVTTKSFTSNELFQRLVVLNEADISFVTDEKEGVLCKYTIHPDGQSALQSLHE